MTIFECCSRLDSQISKFRNRNLVFCYVDQFNVILDCALPYIHLIPYPDCVRGTGHRRLEATTELLLVLTICRRGLHQGIMSYIVGMSNATVQRIFCGWVIFLATLFNEIGLKPPSGYKLKTMPKKYLLKLTKV